MDKSNNLYDQVIEVTEDYLGPASKRFIDRQIANHLPEKNPQQIARSDLDELIDWIMAAIAILTEDKRMIDEFTARLKELSGDSKVRA